MECDIYYSWNEICKILKNKFGNIKDVTEFIFEVESELHPYGSLMQRFWSKVDKKSDNECWNWKAAKDIDGYGHFCLDRKLSEVQERTEYLGF